MQYPPDSFKSRAHALIQSLPDNATWRTLIDSAIDRMELEAEAESLHAAATKELQSSNKSDYDA